MSQAEQKIECFVDEQSAGLRLDKFLNKKIDNLSRTYLHKLIQEGRVKLNEQILKPSFKVALNQAIVVNIPKIKELEVEAQELPIEILYQDQDLIVVNKAKGMVVHPAAGNYSGTLVNALLYEADHLSSINGVVRPGIVHRIDKDTSGVLVVAKNDMAHASLSKQLKEHTMKREYIALVHGVIKNDKGTINAPIGRHKEQRKKMAVVEGGRHAVTHFEVLRRFDRYTLIKARLETGRTHQIRVHMAYIKYPLVGDEVYGPKKSKINVKGQMLHAAVLGFIHPRTGEYMEFSIPVPKEFDEVIQKIVKIS
jgi:23S rRNA pseudouridine1911/1915/1917 synthase